MCFKGRKKYSLRKRQYRRKKQKESGKKIYLKDGVLQFGDKRKIRECTFPFGALVPIALRAI